MGYSINRGKGGQYAYFFCLGRAKKRTDCDLPYLPADDVEDCVIRLWHHETLSNVEAADTKRRTDHHLSAMRQGQSRELTSAEREVAKLTTAKKRLLDAYLAEAVSLPDFQTKQAEMVARLDVLTRDVG